MWQQIRFFLENSLPDLHMPRIRVTDVLEVLIISFVLYQFLVWAKRTRMWSLFRGFIVIIVFILIAILFNMTTIIWITERILSIAIIAVVVILQPELRKAVEGLGRKRYLSGLLPFDAREAGRFSDKTITEISRASFEMAKVRTGALIVMEREQSLSEFEQTGIKVDALVSSQLLINIFEHNTPLHDGAVIVRGDRVTSATCYLPLSDNMDLDKDLGTRHRAGVGVSEVTDSLTIIISEETGKISVACQGELERDVNPERLRERIRQIQDKPELIRGKRFWRRSKKA